MWDRLRQGFGGALGAPDFLRLWIGQVISMLGDRLDQMGVVALYVAAGAHSVTSLLATLAALVIAPQVAVSLFAGHLIDRFDRRRILILSDAVRALLVLALPLAFYRAGSAGVYGIAILLGTATAFFTPAKSAVIPLLVPEKALPAANGLSATTNIIATLIGSVLGAHLAEALGVTHGASPLPFFVFDALTYGISGFLVWRIVRDLRPRATEPEKAAQAPLRLRSLLRTDPDLLWILACAFLFWVVAAIVYSSINSMAYVRFHRGIVGIGNLQASLGAGMLIGALIAGSVGSAGSALRSMPLLFCATGASLWLLAASATWAVALAAVVITGALAAWVLVLVDTFLQKRVSNPLRGRVFGLNQQSTAIAFMAPSLLMRFDPSLDHDLPSWLRVAALALLAFALLLMGRSASGGSVPGADWGRPWLNALDRLNRRWCTLVHRLQVQGVELPPTGGALLVANHVSGLDPLLLLAATRRPLRFLIAQEEYERWWLRWLLRAMGCIPVEAARPHRALSAAERVLAQGEVVALFPQGGIFPPGPIAQLKRGVALLARRAQVPVVAVHIAGVRGAGLKVAAVFVPSPATRLTGFPAMACGDDGADFLALLSDRLGGSGPV